MRLSATSTTTQSCWPYEGKKRKEVIPIHTLDDLRIKQALPLDLKIGLSKNLMHAWLKQHDAFVSFSGGEDSSVALHIARQVDPHIPAVFLNTRTEHKSLREVVKAADNVTTIFPEISFAQAVEQCGWCVPSKEIAHHLAQAQRGNAPSAKNIFAGLNADGTVSDYRTRVFKPYAYLIDAPFSISARCCDLLKKDPIKKYEQEHEVTSIVGTLADESPNRRNSWLEHGCNAWRSDRPKSAPLSFWTKQDILQYIRLHDLPLASVYGEIVEGKDGKLRTTGVDRTGCVPCPVGARRYSKTQLSKFELLARDDPRYHTGLMRSRMGLREVLLWINAPLGCTACGGRCYCGTDPNAPRYSGECVGQMRVYGWR